jgi:hypothetical protein
MYPQPATPPTAAPPRHVYSMMDWTAGCDRDDCDEPNAQWFRSVQGTGAGDPVVECPTCDPPQ